MEPGKKNWFLSNETGNRRSERRRCEEMGGSGRDLQQHPIFLLVLLLLFFLAFISLLTHTHTHTHTHT